jgi:hypothetical protein
MTYGSGQLTVNVSGSTHVIMDVNRYFTDTFHIHRTVGVEPSSFRKKCVSACDYLPQKEKPRQAAVSFVRKIGL